MEIKIHTKLYEIALYKYTLAGESLYQKLIFKYSISWTFYT